MKSLVVTRQAEGEHYIRRKVQCIRYLSLFLVECPTESYQTVYVYAMSLYRLSFPRLSYIPLYLEQLLSFADLCVQFTRTAFSLTSPSSHEKGKYTFSLGTYNIGRYYKIRSLCSTYIKVKYSQ